jgi:hypothetical protein
VANVDDQPVVPDQPPAPTAVGEDRQLSGGREDREAQAEIAAENQDAEAQAAVETAQRTSDDRKHTSDDPLAEFGTKVTPESILRGDGWLDNAAPAEGSSIGKSLDERTSDYAAASDRARQLDGWWQDHGPTWDNLKQEKASLDGEYTDIAQRAAAGTASQDEIDGFVARSNDWQSRSEAFWREGDPAVGASVKAERDLSDARRGVTDLMTAQAQDDASAIAQRDEGNTRFGQYDQQQQTALQDFDTARSAPGAPGMTRSGTGGIVEFDEIQRSLNQAYTDAWTASHDRMWYQGGSLVGPQPKGQAAMSELPQTPEEEKAYFENRYGHEFSPDSNPVDKGLWESMQYDVQLERNARAAQAAHANDPSPFDVVMAVLGGVQDFSTRFFASSAALTRTSPSPSEVVTRGMDAYTHPTTPDGYPINQVSDFLAAIPYVFAGDTSMFSPNTKAYFDYIQKVGPANTFVQVNGEAPGGRALGLYDVPVLGGFAHASASLLSLGPVNILPEKLYADIKAGMPYAELEKKYPGTLAPQLLWDLALNPINYVPIGKVDEFATAARARRYSAIARMRSPRLPARLPAIAVGLRRMRGSPISPMAASSRNLPGTARRCSRRCSITRCGMRRRGLVTA